jgi:hypothetical protein
MEMTMNRLIKFLGLGALAVLGACGEDGGIPNPLDVCGFRCPGEELDGTKLLGVADGHAEISGVPRVDAFFSATIAFQTAANGVSDGIQFELDQIKADFGIEGELAAGLQAKFDTNLQAGIKFEYQPPRCAIDAQATIEASAKCDVEASAGMVSVECKGSCEAELTADVKCDANADLICTFTPPAFACDAKCQGSCNADISGGLECGGTCRGTCDGECSAFSDAEGTQCAGTCSGNCTGKCETKLTVAAECKGECRGECVVENPSGGCEGGIRAECKAKGSASIMCQGSCEGEVEPPMVSADCKASARAEASVNVECTPPRLGMTYAFSGEADAEFKAALKGLLDVRLPALLKATSKAKVVSQAGEGLGVAAQGAVDGAIDAIEAEAKLNLSLINNLKCAAGQLPAAKKIITDSADNLTAKLMDADDVTKMLGLGT